MLHLFKSKKDKEALDNESWFKEIEEELDQFNKNNVWSLVPKYKNISIIGIK